MKDKSSDAPLSQVFGSVFAAMFGVQSDKNRERDFNATNPKMFLIAGVVFTLGFIAAIVAVVNIVVG